MLIEYIELPFTAFFSTGVDYVFDVSIARSLALRERLVLFICLFITYFVHVCYCFYSFFKTVGRSFIVVNRSCSYHLKMGSSGKEFVRRLKNERENGALPIITSACPGWICYAEKTRPETLPYIRFVSCVAYVVVNQKGNHPVTTVNYKILMFRPDTINFVTLYSNVKSPQQIMGSLIKYHFASRAGIL